jgi:hypothetical protein
MTNILRWITPVLLVILTISLSACSHEPTTSPETEPVLTPETTQPTSTVNEPEPSATLEPGEPPTEKPAETGPVPDATPPEETTPSPSTVIAADFEPTLKSHFGFMPAHLDFQGAKDAGGDYDRPHFEFFQWGMIEKEPGFFDFHETDEYVRQAQSYGMHILANIQPFAQWDQAVCHQDLPPAEQSPDPDWSPTKGKPCDMEAYRDFVVRLVERYDGDGTDDMPGLTYPIKHWEVMNEPEFCTGELVFFQGDAADYYDILKTTCEAVKAADPEAYIVQGGMAGMMDIDIEFWQEVFDLGGAEYIDIMNMHSIGHGEHLNIPAFRRLLDDNGIEGKPIWVTEVQYQQSHQTQDYTNDDFAKILARSYIYALANGVDKLFYVNIRMPFMSGKDGPPFDERSAIITDDGQKSALFYAHLTIAEMLGELGKDDTVEIISESIVDWHIEAGQYRFVIDGRIVYALWGGGPAPAEITGEVTVVDISGTEKVMDAASLVLSDSPVFVIID